MTAAEEMQIIKKVLEDDKSAFEELVLANQKNVYNLAFKMTGVEDDALDISQEAFLKAYKYLREFRGDSKFSVWLYRLTYNLCVDFLRKKTRTRAIPLTYQDEHGDAEELEIPDMRSLPEDAALRRETRRAIDESISELGAGHREIIIMREITGMSYGEIAKTLSISEGTVKSRLSRARKSLANILAARGTFPEGFRQKGEKEVRERE